MSRPFNIIITGAAGFIGSSLVADLNDNGFVRLILVDNFSKPGKDRYLNGKYYIHKIESADLFHFLETREVPIDFVFHLGGKTSYKTDFQEQNVHYSQQLFKYCCKRKIPFVYASSSSTYGSGELGYDDDESLIPTLIPLNDYGRSKNDFDNWMLKNSGDCPYAGLKIFNVFGPNEYHKGQSASVAFKSYFEIKETGKVTLFGSSGPGIKPGDQLRDFIYVKDVVGVFHMFLHHWLTFPTPEKFPNGIYNLGTGIGRSFNDVARAVFHSMGLPEKIAYKDIPESIISGYRESTIAEMSKLKNIDFGIRMYSLEDAIDDMVKNYLESGSYY